MLVLYPAPPLTFVMASQLDKDDYVYDIDNITALLASMDAASLEAGGARPRKSKRLAAKSAGKAAGKSGTSKQPPQLPPASSTDSLLELEKLKNQNLKMELEIVKAQLELEKVKSASVEPETPPSGVTADLDPKLVVLGFPKAYRINTNV